MTSEKKKSISTTKGDGGETSLLDGTRTRKSALRPEAYGTLDEAQSFIGLARAHSRVPRVKENLLLVQHYIYVINSELACPPDKKDLLERKVNAGDVDRLTKIIDAIEAAVDLPPKFIVYGETKPSAFLDTARAVVRRAERALNRLEEAEKIDNQSIKAFINRLSDLLYLLARLEEREAGVPLRHPETP